MDDREFAKLAAFMQAHWWSAEIPPSALSAYFAALAEFDYAEAEVAVEVLAREGKEFAPTAGQIVNKVIELQIDPPSWAEVARILRRACYQAVPYVTFPEDGGPGVRVNPRAEFIKQQHPLVVSFIGLIGLETFGQMEWTTTADAQFRRKWEEHVQTTISQRRLVGLDAPGLHAIARARRELPERLGEDIRQEVDRLRALPAGAS